MTTDRLIFFLYGISVGVDLALVLMFLAQRHDRRRDAKVIATVKARLDEREARR